MQQGTEDPAVGLSALHRIKEAELFITVMTGVTAVEFQLLWTFFVYLEAIQSLLSGFTHGLSSGSLLDRGGNRFSSSWKGGWPLPCPPQQSCLSWCKQAGEGWKTLFVL